MACRSYSQCLLCKNSKAGDRCIITNASFEKSDCNHLNDKLIIHKCRLEHLEHDLSSTKESKKIKSLKEKIEETRKDIKKLVRILTIENEKAV